MTWISVNDHLPAIDSRVLVRNKDNDSTIAFFISTGKYYYFCIGQDVKQTWEPTHWQYSNDKIELA